MGHITDRFARFMELRKDIDFQIGRLEELEASAGNVGAAPFDSIGHGKGRPSDRTAYTAARIADLKDHIKELVELERTEYRALDSLLCTVSDGGYLLTSIERAAIRTRYFDLMTLEQAAEALDRSNRGVDIACKRGLAKLEEVHPEDKKEE